MCVVCLDVSFASPWTRNCVCNQGRQASDVYLYRKAKATVAEDKTRHALPDVFTFVPAEKGNVSDCARAPEQLDGALFFFPAEDGIRDLTVTGVQTCALPI